MSLKSSSLRTTVELLHISSIFAFLTVLWWADVKRAYHQVICKVRVNVKAGFDGDLWSLNVGIKYNWPENIYKK